MHDEKLLSAKPSSGVWYAHVQFKHGERAYVACLAMAPGGSPHVTSVRSRTRTGKGRELRIYGPHATRLGRTLQNEVIGWAHANVRVAGAVASFAAAVLTADPGELRARSIYEHCARQKADAIREQRAQDRLTGFDALEHGDYCDNEDDARTLYMAGWNARQGVTQDDMAEALLDVQQALTECTDDADSYQRGVRNAFDALLTAVIAAAYPSPDEGPARVVELSDVMRMFDDTMCSLTDSAIAEAREKV